MANSNQGEGRSVNWGHPLNPSLPPKSPSVTLDAGSFPFPGCTGRSNGSKQHHQRTPSAGFVPQMPLSWIDDMLDSPDAPARKVLHRRSASDSAAFLDGPDNLNRLPDDLRRESREDDFQYRNLACTPLPNRTPEFERLDDEQIMSMFAAEVEPFQRSRSGLATVGNSGVTESSEKKTASDNLSSPSDSNSGNDMSIENGRPGSLSCPKTEPDEVQSENGNEGPKQPTASSHIDPNMDPKRAKRCGLPKILANRQSAQRSRVRKLQYIAELERSVTALQTEVSALTPQVAYLDHQRILLNVDNNTIKQRIAALMQDKRFKDAQNEALTREVHRLRQLFQQQQDEFRSQVQQYNLQHQQLSKLESSSTAENEGKHVPSDAFGFVKNGVDAQPANCLLGENGNHLVDEEFANQNL